MGDDVIEIKLPPGLTLEKLIKLAEKPTRRGGTRKFRCFSCQEERPLSELAGELCNKKICKFCYDHLSNEQVGCTIKFDRTHGHPA